ncbi:hypothetical protein ACN27G_28805 [Plantactinospora sp. WMMB334]|uniref:hypothetical protein n=1 Tax=Plantactinospora sp. WMMB334 TaxID=3404119 RepID=UPI003B92BC8C
MADLWLNRANTPANRRHSPDTSTAGPPDDRVLTDQLRLGAEHHAVRQQMVPLLVEDRLPTWVRVLSQLAIAFTLGGIALTSVVAAAVFPMASDPCSSDASAFICTPQGQHIAAAAPFYGGLTGTGVIAIAIYIGPRRYRPLWAAVGFTIAVTGWMTGYAIAVTAE